METCKKTWSNKKKTVIASIYVVRYAIRLTFFLVSFYTRMSDANASGIFKSHNSSTDSVGALLYGRKRVTGLYRIWGSGFCRTYILPCNICYLQLWKCRVFPDYRSMRRLGKILQSAIRFALLCQRDTC